MSKNSVVNWVSDLDGVLLDAIVMSLTVVGLIGNLLDIRSHDTGTTFEEEGFLTLPHIIFYSAFAAIALLIIAVIVAKRIEGSTWVDSIPVGYKYGVVGIVLFGIGGPSDALWHSLFDAESGVEALTSPTHLLLASGSVLFLSSPLRRAWIHRGFRGINQVPMILSGGFMYTAVTIITLYGHPVFGDQWVRNGDEISLGVVSIMFQAGILAGLLVLLIRRFDLVPGAFTLIFLLNGIAMTWVGESYALLPGIVLTGVIADALYFVLKPSMDGGVSSRIFVAVIPFIYYLLYFVSIELTGGIEWVIHIWAGSIALAGLMGLLVGYTAAPSTQKEKPGQS